MPVPIGGLDSVDLTYDSAYLDEAITAAADQTAADTAVATEESLLKHHLAKRTVSGSTVADATRGKAIYRVPVAVTGGGKIITIYQKANYGLANLWIAAEGNDDGNSVSSAYPSGFTDGTSTASGASANGAHVGSARRAAHEVIQDPGTFTITSQEWAAQTYGIRPHASTPDTTPVIEEITPTSFGADATTHLVGMPATCNSGDLLFMLFACDGNPTITTPAGWTLLHDTASGTACRLAAYVKISDGTEDGATVDVVTSASEMAAAQVYRIQTGTWSGTIATGIVIGTAATGTSANPNPPSATDTWSVYGLVYRQSNDGGETWQTEVQISTRQDVYPSAVMNPSTGDVHVVYALTGTPALAATHSVWYRPLPFTGSAWSIGSETAVLTGSATVGYTDVSLDVNSSGTMRLLCNRKPSGGANTTVGRASSGSPWDFTTASSSTPITTTATADVRVKHRICAGSPYESVAVTEQNGTWRVYTSIDGVSYTLQQTFFEESTAEFDILYHPTSELVAIVQKDGDNVIFRTFNTNTLGIELPTTLAGDATNPARAPSISRSGTYWVVAYVQDVASNQRALRMLRSDNWSRVYHLDTDPNADGMSWVKLPAVIDDVEMIVAMMSDTLNTPYGVKIVKTETDIFKTVSDTAVMTQTARAGPQQTDTGTAAEAVVAGEAIAASDTGGISAEALSQIRNIAETATGAETMTNVIGGAGGAGVADSGQGIETIRQDLEADDTGEGSDAAVAAERIDATDTADGDDAVVVRPSFAGDTGRGVETLVPQPHMPDTGTGTDTPAREVPVADTVTATEAFEDPDGVAGFGVSIEDSVRARETFGGTGGAGAKNRFDILGVGAAQRVFMHPGPSTALGWDRRAGPLPFVGGQTRLFVYEDVDEDYNGIVFVCTPQDASRWLRLKRSTDQGRTFTEVGPAMMACIARGPDGVLWGVGNDLTTIENAPNPDGLFGYRAVCRQIFKSVDKGANWSRVYNDTTYAFAVGTTNSFPRYPHYVHIAVDSSDPDRVWATGVKRGTVFGKEGQSAQTTNGGVSWSVRIEPGFYRASASPAYNATFGVGMLLIPVGGGRFLFCGRPGATVPDEMQIWATDDFGATWTPKYSFDQSVDATWSDFQYKPDGRLYIVKHLSGGDPVDDELLLRSDDDGDTFTPVETPVGPGTDGYWNAVAYDYRLSVLYLGSHVGAAGNFVFRMDDPDAGTWVDITDDAVTVLNDDQPDIGWGGLRVLNTITGVIETRVTDVASITEFLPIEVEVATTGEANEEVTFAFGVFDTATAEALFEIIKRNALTVRLFMNDGHVKIRLEGTTAPAVPTNPEG